MVHHMARWSSGLRLRPLTPATRVRISYGSPSSLAQSVERSAVNRNVVGSSPTGGASLRKETQTEHRASGVPIVGVDGGGGTPVPIPNTAVKPTCAENTWLEAARENKQVPTQAASGYTGCCFIFLLSSVGRAIVHKNDGNY